MLRYLEMKNWYLVYSKARQEGIAERGLAEQGYDVYLPMLRTRRRRAKGMVEIDEPLFPRYLFVAPTDQEQSISPVRYTAGVSKLVRFSAEFEPVPQSMIEATARRARIRKLASIDLLAPDLKARRPSAYSNLVRSQVLRRCSRLAQASDQSYRVVRVIGPAGPYRDCY